MGGGFTMEVGSVFRSANEIDPLRVLDRVLALGWVQTLGSGRLDVDSEF
jgi:hypothetical protein